MVLFFFTSWGTRSLSRHFSHACKALQKCTAGSPPFGTKKEQLLLFLFTFYKTVKKAFLKRPEEVELSKDKSIE